MNQHEKGTQTKAAFIYRECPVIYLIYSFTFFHGRLFSIVYVQFKKKHYFVIIMFILMFNLCLCFGIIMFIVLNMVIMQFTDKAAAAGYYVVVPDFFHGDWRPVDFYNQDRRLAKKHAPEQAIEFAKPIIQALKEKGVKVPTGILGAKIDKMSPPELVKEFEVALVANEVIFLANEC
ncbi:putative alpha/Beta hydrolase [Helianthus annuus]|uniref:Alpha/Beta hydrolase n=1 Tax=Helianthus annuus TaxID=4232 RepID=A0A251TI82_HELAN|nr:putative alpha/Beta hydrolase [Helianthus annuus]KAJ0528517.1 putative alpha/Beta hydrolase [Helianthus annuus]